MYICPKLSRMTERENIKLQVAISVLQGLIEAKGGVIDEALPRLAVKESLRFARTFVEEWDKEETLKTNGKSN